MRSLILYRNFPSTYTEHDSVTFSISSNLAGHLTVNNSDYLRDFPYSGYQRQFRLRNPKSPEAQVQNDGGGQRLPKMNACFEAPELVLSNIEHR